MLLVLIMLLPAILATAVVMLRPALVIISLLIVLAIALRGVAGYVEQRRGRW